jgi:hypothetical protein
MYSQYQFIIVTFVKISLEIAPNIKVRFSGIAGDKGQNNTHWQLSQNNAVLIDPL